MLSCAYDIIFLLHLLVTLQDFVHVAAEIETTTLAHFDELAVEATVSLFPSWSSKAERDELLQYIKVFVLCPVSPLTQYRGSWKRNVSSSCAALPITFRCALLDGPSVD